MFAAVAQPVNGTQVHLENQLLSCQNKAEASCPMQILLSDRNPVAKHGNSPIGFAPFKLENQSAFQTLSRHTARMQCFGAHFVSNVPIILNLMMHVSSVEQKLMG